MGFSSTPKFVPSTKKEIRNYGKGAVEKEKKRLEERKFRLESLEKRFRIQIEKCAEGNATLGKLLADKPSKTVRKNAKAFLVRYFTLLADKRLRQLQARKIDPKSTFMWDVKAPKLDLLQQGQFVIEVQASWCVFNWDDMTELLNIVIGKKKHGLPELTTVTEFVKRAMLQILGASPTKTSFSLSSPEATFELWEPLRKKYMGKKQKLIEAIEAIDETPVKKKKKRTAITESAEFAEHDRDQKKLKKIKKLDEAPAEIPTKKKKRVSGSEEVSEKPKKKEKLNGHDESDSKRLPNLKDDSVLKTKGKHEYRKGMGQVWSLLTKEGITAKKFFGLAAKKKMDPVRTRIYLATMRRSGSVTVS